MEDTELRTRLEALAYRTAPPPQDVNDLVATVAERHFAGRRRQLLLAAAAAVVVAVLVFNPAVLTGPDRDSDPASPATPTGVYTTPTRGGLSDQVDFLEAMRRRPWLTGTNGSDVLEPPLDTRRVVFAGRSSGPRWVLVAGADPSALPPDEGVDAADLDELGSVAIAWFTGPYGAAPEEMTVYGEPRIVDADEPTAVLSPTHPYPGPTVSFGVVVAAPGDQVEMSLMYRWIEPGGEISRREFERVSTVDGVALVSAGQVDASIDRSPRYRVVRGGTEFSGSMETEPREDFVPPVVDLARLRPAPPPAVGDAAVTSAIDELLSHLGRVAESVDFTVLWAGDLPTPDGADARLTVLHARFGDDEGVYVTGALGWDSGGEQRTGSCGSETLPAGTRPEQRIVVLRCAPGDGAELLPTDSLVVVAPAAATTARALDADGESLGEYPLTDGVAVVPVPADLGSVEVIGADGETLDERAPMGEVDFGD